MRSEANLEQRVFLTAAAARPSLGMGGASHAFDVASRRRIEGFDLVQIQAQLRTEGYSEFAIQLFAPSISRLIKRGLMPMEGLPADRRRWRRRLGAVRRWIVGQSRTPQPPPAARETIEDQLDRQLQSMKAIRRR